MEVLDSYLIIGTDISCMSLKFIYENENDIHI